MAPFAVALSKAVCDQVQYNWVQRQAAMAGEDSNIVGLWARNFQARAPSG
jgi:hypothetical protein